LRQSGTHVATSLILVSTAFIVKAIKASLNEQTPLNATRFCVLLALLRSDAPENASQLACSLAISGSTASLAVRRLEKDGFIQRSATEGDRRTHCLQVTAAGKQAIALADAVVAETVGAIWQPLSAEQRTEMLRCALRAVKNQRRERNEGGMLRADTAYVEGTLIGYNAFAAAIQLHGLSYFEAAALAWMSENGHSSKKGNLAEALLIKANYLSQICDSLRERGLISEIGGSDRRVVRVELTDAGRERIHRTLASLDDVVAHSIYTNSAEEQALFRETARIIVTNEINHRRHGLQAEMTAE
jgi:DNA-binding MarR family transcriptional regulator